MIIFIAIQLLAALDRKLQPQSTHPLQAAGFPIFGSACDLMFPLFGAFRAGQDMSGGKWQIKGPLPLQQSVELLWAFFSCMEGTQPLYTHSGYLLNDCSHFSKPFSMGQHLLILKEHPLVCDSIEAPRLLML